ncbi:hypothetical protein LZ30DRAFT_611175, partial [Colletotrichum cereale]
MRPGTTQPRSLFLASLVLAGTPHFAAATVPDAHAQRRDNGATYDNSYFVIQGTWKCTTSQLAIIDSSIKEAKELATTAVNALKVKGVETSEAFHVWLGRSTATPQLANTILNNHFETAFSLLPEPATPAAFRWTNAAEFKAPLGEPPLTNDSLVWGCPPLADQGGQICRERVQASVARVRGVENAPTMLILCPEFFEVNVTNAQMIELYKASLSNGDFSKGQILLHELQHMFKTTFPSPAPADLDEPLPETFGNKDCYSAGCCARLPDSQKLQNAENFAMFALDVSAFPELAKPGS